MNKGSRKKILVAGVGNIFKGDDAFGVEVARRLSARIAPEESDSVDVVDFGIRGVDLAYTLLESDHDLVILVDAVERGGTPGTLYLIRPDLSGDGEPRDATADTHGFHPARVFQWVKAMGGELRGIRLLGCEPQELGTDEELKMGLSDPVRRAIEPAVAAVEDLVREARCTS